MKATELWNCDNLSHAQRLSRERTLLGEAVVNTSRCPLLLTRDLSAFGFRLGGVSRLYFALHQTSRSRGGGKVGISHRGRDFQGVVGSGGNLVSVCTGFHSSVFSTALVGLCERPPLAIEPSHHMRAVAQRHPPVQMFVNRHRTTGQRAAEARLLDLPHSVADRD